MTATGVGTGTWSLQGPSASSWMFAVRIWIAMVLALYVAFWLQIESASSAAVTVGILALPTRGQALQKAAYRFVANALGVVASIVIVGLFAQSRDLYVAAFALWIGLCVFCAGFLDGNRAYGAVLAGYNVAVVAVQQIDSPQSVFLGGVNRGSAITVGIAALAVVNVLFEAPAVRTKLIAAFGAVRREVEVLTSDAARRGGADPARSAGVLRAIAALHADATALAPELPGGRARASAAGNLMVALVAEVSAIRALAEGRPSGSPALVVDDRRASAAFADLEAARMPAVALKTPLYRAPEAALRNGLRAALAIMLASVPFILGGWSASSLGYSLVGVTVALSAINPNPAAFAKGALIAMPLAAACAGITEFLVLDGVDQFPLLAIALAPAVFLGSFLVASGKPKLVVVGGLLLVFFPVLLGLGNPQSYNPQTYVDGAMLSVTAVILLSMLLAILLPTTDERRQQWILASMRREVRAAMAGRPTRHSPEEAAFRDADRIGQLAGLKTGASGHDEALREALALFDLAGAVRRARASLKEQPRSGTGAARIALTGAALASGDSSRLRAASAAWASVPGLATDLDRAARLIAGRGVVAPRSRRP